MKWAVGEGANLPIFIKNIFVGAFGAFKFPVSHPNLVVLFVISCLSELRNKE